MLQYHINVCNSIHIACKKSRNICDNLIKMELIDYFRFCDGYYYPFIHKIVSTTYLIEGITIDYCYMLICILLS